MHRHARHGVWRHFLLSALVACCCLALTGSCSCTGAVLEIHPESAHTQEAFECLANGLRAGDELILHGGIFSQSGRRAYKKSPPAGYQWAEYMFFNGSTGFCGDAYNRPGRNPVPPAERRPEQARCVHKPGPRKPKSTYRCQPYPP